MCNSAIRQADRCAAGPKVVAGVRGREGGICRWWAGSAGLFRRGRHAASHQQSAKYLGRLWLRERRERLSRGWFTASSQSAGNAEGMLGDKDRAGHRGAWGIMGVGLQLSRHRLEHVQGDEDHARLKRACKAGVYQRDRLLSHAHPGRRADTGAA